MSEPISLNDLQRWMQTVITHPDGIQAGIASSDAASIIDVLPDDVERIILPSQSMSSLARLQIYGRAYFGRLIECLTAVFPAVHHAVGDEAFNGLAFGYLTQHPSRSYTLAFLSDSFDAHLSATRPPRSVPHEPDFADFLIELAKLERTYCEVFDGPGPEHIQSLQSSDLVGLTADEFADCRLELFTCVRLLELQFPVHEYASAVRKNIEPTPPFARPVYLVVTRRDYIVRRLEVTRPQFDLLSALARRATIGEAVAVSYAGAETDLHTLSIELREWFRDWTAAPLFERLIRGEDLNVQR